jgi:hypothetical protein
MPVIIVPAAFCRRRARHAGCRSESERLLAGKRSALRDPGKLNPWVAALSRERKLG